MEIIPVSSHEFASVISEPYHGFNCAFFNEINKINSDEVYYLLFKDKKYRLGIVGGKKDGGFASPFSAPFGGFSYLSQGINTIKYLEQAIEILDNWCIAADLKKISITLPPPIYNSKFISKQLNSLYRSGYNIVSIDLNYHFINKDAESGYMENISASARKQLNQSLNNKLTFYKCGDSEDRRDAYKVISRNRISKNFPLRMKYEDIEKTEIRKDFFLVKNKSEVNIAAAIVYFVSPDVVQVVYWGDDPEYSASRTMNFLSYHIFRYYYSLGVLYTDIGPSTENSVPNYGLCDFKEAIGCQILAKTKLEKLL
ncbi:hypothetical protein N9H70_09935 [Pseudomonadales bacterium]|jgi:hypothetical protein|nr:hypothetical protein [Pseudomonadales bacterium]